MPIAYGIVVEYTNLSAGSGHREYTTLGEYPSSSSSSSSSRSGSGIAEVCKQVLQRIDAKTDHRRTYAHPKYNFHYKLTGQYVYMCAADVDFPLRVCFALLDDLEAHHLRTRATKLTTTLKEKIAFYNKPENDKILDMKNKIDDVKAVMLTNIDKVLERGDQIDSLLDSTLELEEASREFRSGSRKLKNNMLKRNIALVLLLLSLVFAALLVVILIIVFSICGVTFKNC